MLKEQTNQLYKEAVPTHYDVIIIGAGPGGIFAAYELMQRKPELRVAILEAGHALNRRRCPIDGEKIKTCIGCSILCDFGSAGTKLYSTAGTRFKKQCIENNLHLLDVSVRHLGTDINYTVLENLYAYLSERVTFSFDTPVERVIATERGYEVVCKGSAYSCNRCIISVGQSGSKRMEKACKALEIPTKSNRVDIGVRVELPAEVFSHLTDELYESKIIYRTQKYGDKVRTFCMNPRGAVVNENTNGIITVNGHGYEDPALQTGNAKFALLVAKHFSEPFKDSNGYGESLARLSNMRGGGVHVARDITKD